ncbi:hypothetical protein SAMN05661010_01334 [Modicisalibacter muralis]|uniref:Uncharacterized protein n=1 Tax=Modicisalibacter muralis TaxID=119000 RepID=A0A1G9IUU2_9GAMM|nr:hypothetical protein [Halomonas muralis]SDL28584.1 hypothetical protein SAMN05661010_01334 [Halomonas muralis]
MSRVQREFLVADTRHHHALTPCIGDTPSGRPTNVAVGVLAQQRDTD